MELAKNVKTNGHNNYTGRMDGQGSNNKHSIACTQTQSWRVGVDCGATRVECAAHSSLPHTLSKEEKKRIR